MKGLVKNTLYAVLLLVMTNVQASSIQFKEVTQDVYAYIGPLENRTAANLGLNNNIGLVDTTAGLVLIDSGAGDVSAKALEKAAKSVSQKPIIAVLNTGSQDHRWLGNHYFASKGAEIYALNRTVKTQQKMGGGLVKKMTKVSKIFANTQPVTATKVLQGKAASLQIGGTTFEFQFFGNAHFPGDAVIWLPKQQVLFSGDLIYTDRMLGVHPFSKVATWQKAFHQAEKLPAKWIVPGHGDVSDWDKARRDTGNYLDKLVEVVSTAVDEMESLEDTVAANREWAEFQHLEHYNSWHKTILNRVYLQLEQAE